MNLATLKRYMKLVATLPIRQVFSKVLGKASSIAHQMIMRRRDLKTGTYDHKKYRDVTAPLLSRFPAGGIGASMPHETLVAIADLYLDHRFDLLGSGWVRVKHGMECNGLEEYRYPSEPTPAFDNAGHWLAGRINSSNLSYSQYVWSLIGTGYLPIDWHIDFKSGYRWRENVWYRDITFGHLPGVDVKVPWELARMQHLPQLAQAYAVAAAGEEGFSSAHVYVDEFRHEVLDFIAMNPPRFGVNWACSMDVGIRVANWLLAYDFFASAGAVFDEKFNNVFKLSVYQHGKHIANNLEWHPVYRGNHYLADIVGLLFVASYLASDPEIDAWLAFGVQELITEVDFQFYEDGSNFEASTSYHRLSAELVVYATALVVGLPRIKLSALNRYDHRLVKGVPSLRPCPIKMFLIPGGGGVQSPFPEWYWIRLEKMAEFTVAIMRPDNQGPQIGDNDSGRLFKISPRYKAARVSDLRRQYKNIKNFFALQDKNIYWFEVHNDQRHLIAAIHVFFERADFVKISQEFKFETAIVHYLAGNLSAISFDASIIRDEPVELDTPLITHESNFHQLQVQRYRFPISLSNADKFSLSHQLRTYIYSDFGLFIYKSNRLYLTVRCGSVGLNGLGAHGHNDPLSIELWLDGQAIVVDAGTYLYTPLPLRRDEFRSVVAHFSPQVEGYEPGNMTHDVFRLGSEANPKCLHFSEGGFLGCYSLEDVLVYRHIQIELDAVSITDWTDKDSMPLVRLNPSLIPYSSGYGWKCNLERPVFND